ncbi:major facilitator superfamily domain-containing protein [Cercophora newfieldiana]|uniref:Major facilitator superfamily domain-containing protein n=1 Tax=Cercophora newfieldiana TaxID=92897 RepID=A0AA40D042_9PEZI|nr:major facilitator superfamily domain-containing protein [Cercophora newfieldiana]
MASPVFWSMPVSIRLRSDAVSRSCTDSLVSRSIFDHLALVILRSDGAPRMATPAVDRRPRSLDIADSEDGARYIAMISELESRLTTNPPSKHHTDGAAQPESYCHKRHHSTESDNTTLDHDPYCHKRRRSTGADIEDSESTAQNCEEKTDVEAGQIEDSDAKEEPYHVFTRRKKWQLVLIVSLAGLFSPLSSNIYFPALGAIADGTGSSLSLVSLTVTVYMVVQGIAPSFWGPLSDARGRRITFIGTFAVYLVANISLALSKDFASLMAFRALQAAGSAATISVGAGVIGDITTSKERGGFMGSFGGIRMLGQSIGPVIGGIITEYFGFQAIFWFLFILGSSALLLILFFLPETLRRIAGNGSVPLRGLDRPFISRSLSHRYWHSKHHAAPTPPPKFTLTSIVVPLRFLFEKDVFCTLTFGAVVYTIWSMVTSSTTAIFQPRFGLSNLQTGLIFLPNGVACVTGSYLTGKLLDRDYRVVESEYRAAKGIPEGVELNRKKFADFPVSRARLRSTWYLVVLFLLSVGGYGFSVESPRLAAKPGMALPLFLQMVIAFTATAIFTQNSALVVDLFPGASASATAVNNLIRCSVGAVGIAVVQFAIDAIGAGISFFIFTVISAMLTPLLGLVWVYGERWRKERMERLGEKEEMPLGL